MRNKVPIPNREDWGWLDVASSDRGRPTDDFVAEAIWRQSNDPRDDPHVAIWWMLHMGYEPFKGFPLVLAGPRHPAAEARHQAILASDEEVRLNCLTPGWVMKIPDFLQISDQDRREWNRE